MPDDPINQLSAILGAHLRALNSIDGNAGKLEGKVSELEARMGGSQRRLPRR
jgi:nuclear pore complex protein Nup62